MILAAGDPLRQPDPMPLSPENRYVVGLNLEGVFCRSPGGPETRLDLADLHAIYVETSDAGPWSADVWWILEGETPDTVLAFPQGATGENAVIDRLRELPGFEIKGMNSVQTARFVCWRR